MQRKMCWLTVVAAALACGCAGGRTSLMFSTSPAEHIKQLKSPNADVRREAVLALGRLKGVAELPAVLKVVGLVARTDEEPTVRAAAMRAMGQTRAPQFVPVLKEALFSDSDAIVRADAAAALSSIDTPEAREALIAALISGTADPDVDVRISAASGLRRYNSREAAGALTDALADPYPAVVHEAWQSLRFITGEDLPADRVKWLMYLAENEEPFAEHGKMPPAQKLTDQREQDRDKTPWYKRLFAAEKRKSELD